MSAASSSAPSRANTPSSRCAAAVVEPRLAPRRAPPPPAAARPKNRAGPGHLEVEPGARRADRRDDGAPVAHDEPLEAPLLAQDAARAARSSSAQYPPLKRLYDVITPSAPPSFTASSNGQQVELAQRALVDHRVHRVALGLRLVADEVLDGHGDVARLHAADVRGGRAARTAAGPRRSIRSCARRAASGACSRSARAGSARRAARVSSPSSGADALDQLRVPRRAERGAAGHAGRA